MDIRRGWRLEIERDWKARKKKKILGDTRSGNPTTPHLHLNSGLTTLTMSGMSLCQLHRVFGVTQVHKAEGTISTSNGYQVRLVRVPGQTLHGNKITTTATGRGENGG